MKKVIVLVALVLVLGFTVRGASADSQLFQQTFEGHTGNVDFFSFNAICDECFDDDIDADSGSSGLGSQIGIDGNFNWTATNQSLLDYTPALVRQGSNLDTSVTTFALPGAATVNYHFYGAWGLFNDPDGVDDPAQTWNPTIWTGSVDTWLSSTIDCALPLHGGINVCQKDEFFGIAVINTPFAQFQMRLKLTTVVTIDSSGVVGVRTAAINAGEPITDAPLVYTGSDPGVFTDPMFISCTQPAGEHLSYSLKNVHLNASSVNLHHSARLNFAVLDPFGIDTWSSLDTPGLQVIDATFGNGVNLATDDVSFDLGKIAPDVTHPTIEPLSFFIGWEGEPIQLHADANDNCGAPTLVWNFSDGGVAYGPDPEHVFADNGVYTGLLTATDVTGLTTTTTFSVTVLNKAPKANAGPDAVEAWGIPVPFNGQAVDPGSADQATLSYEWDFGDNSPKGHAKDVFHAYTTPGEYTATLKVCDKETACDTATRKVTVRKRNTSLGYLGSYNWTFDTQVQLAASLVDEFGQTVNGRNVDFSVGALSLGSASTNSAGIALRGYLVAQSAGSFNAAAAFGGDALYTATGDVGLVHVTTKATNLTYTGAFAGGPNKTIAFSATLKDGDGKPLAGRTVAFQLGAQTATAVTDANGVARTTLKIAQKQGTYTLLTTWSPLGADALRYSPSSDADTFLVGK